MTISHSTANLHRQTALRCASLLVLFGMGVAQAESIDGFSEPYATIDAAATEPGLVVAVEVREGQVVAEGQVLARLDDDVLQATLRIAAEMKDAKGQLQSAAAEAALKSQRAERIKMLRAQGTVTEEEVALVEAERRIAQANLLAAEESLRVKQGEYERVQTQIERRLVRSPIRGVVSDIRRDKGEFVTSLEPIVMTVVQLDPLLAVFSVPVHQADKLAVNGPAEVRVHSAAAPVPGTIETISPVANAQSGTIRVKVRLPNADGKLRSGVKCSLVLP